MQLEVGGAAAAAARLPAGEAEPGCRFHTVSYCKASLTSDECRYSSV